MTQPCQNLHPRATVLEAGLLSENPEIPSLIIKGLMGAILEGQCLNLIPSLKDLPLFVDQGVEPCWEHSARFQQGIRAPEMGRVAVRFAGRTRVLAGVYPTERELRSRARLLSRRMST